MTMSLVLPAAVSVREVGLRDGLQLEAPVDLDDKIAHDGGTRGHRRATDRGDRIRLAARGTGDGRRRTGCRATAIAGPEVTWSALVASPNGARRALAAGFTQHRVRDLRC